MSNSFVFHLPKDSDEMIHKFNLHNVLTNSRTSIFENDRARFSIDRKVVRVLLFDENNLTVLEEIRNYFYGEQYEKL